jgi:serine/threonine-protein kinase
VVLEMDKNLLEHVRVTREGTTLRIGLDPSEAYHMENIDMRAEITMPRLTGLTMNLSDDGEITGFKSEDNLVIDLSKSSLRGEVHAGNLEITAEVGCSVNLSGSAADVTVKATMDSDVDLSELECHDAVVTAEVSSQVIVYPTGRLDAMARANSQVQYVGDPTLGEIRSELGGSVEEQ